MMLMMMMSLKRLMMMMLTIWWELRVRCSDENDEMMMMMMINYWILMMMMMLIIDDADDDDDAADLAGVARRKQWWARKVVGSISGGLDWAADDEDNQGGWQLIKLTKSWHCQDMFAEKNTFCGKGFVFWSSLTQHPPPALSRWQAFSRLCFLEDSKGKARFLSVKA